MMKSSHTTELPPIEIHIHSGGGGGMKRQDTATTVGLGYSIPTPKSPDSVIRTLCSPRPSGQLPVSRKTSREDLIVTPREESLSGSSFVCRKTGAKIRALDVLLPSNGSRPPAVAKRILSPIILNGAKDKNVE